MGNSKRSNNLKKWFTKIKNKIIKKWNIKSEKIDKEDYKTNECKYWIKYKEAVKDRLNKK